MITYEQAIKLAQHIIAILQCKLTPRIEQEFPDILALFLDAHTFLYRNPTPTDEQATQLTHQIVTTLQDKLFPRIEQEFPGFLALYREAHTFLLNAGLAQAADVQAAIAHSFTLEAEAAAMPMHCPYCGSAETAWHARVGLPTERGHGHNPSLFCRNCQHNYVFWLDEHGRLSSAWSKSDGRGPPERQGKQKAKS
jgi:hypothetical protein